DVEEVYQQIEQQSHLQHNDTMNQRAVSPAINETVSQSTAYEDELLEKLLLLEEKLQADKQRKLAHQKPQLQQQWMDEIEK
ncbi:ABC transporter ATP-binding protein, partial [Escherichia coli]